MVVEKGTIKKEGTVNERVAGFGSEMGYQRRLLEGSDVA